MTGLSSQLISEFDIKVAGIDIPHNELLSLLRVSLGVMDASELDNSSFFCQEAKLPRTPWRLLNTNEQQALIASDNYDPTVALWLFKLPKDASKSTRLYMQEKLSLKGGFDILIELTDKRLLLKQPGVSDLVKPILQGIAEVFSLKVEKLRPLALEVTRPCESTVWHPAKQRLLGLHLDSFTRGDTKARLEKSSHRISVNLGEEDRSLSFFNLSVAAMEQILEGKGIDVTGNPDEALKVFMATYPEYPVVNIKIPSDWGYVALTDYVGHDGYAAEKLCPDIHFQIFSDFREVFRKLA